MRQRSALLSGITAATLLLLVLGCAPAAALQWAKVNFYDANANFCNATSQTGTGYVFTNNGQCSFSGLDTGSVSYRQVICTNSNGPAYYLGCKNSTDCSGTGGNGAQCDPFTNVTQNACINTGEDQLQLSSCTDVQPTTADFPQGWIVQREAASDNDCKSGTLMNLFGNKPICQNDPKRNESQLQFCTGTRVSTRHYPRLDCQGEDYTAAEELCEVKPGGGQFASWSKSFSCSSPAYLNKWVHVQTFRKVNADNNTCAANAVKKDLYALANNQCRKSGPGKYEMISCTSDTCYVQMECSNPDCLGAFCKSLLTVTLNQCFDTDTNEEAKLIAIQDNPPDLNNYVGYAMEKSILAANCGAGTVVSYDFSKPDVCIDDQGTKSRRYSCVGAGASRYDFQLVNNCTGQQSVKQNNCDNIRNENNTADIGLSSELSCVPPAKVGNYARIRAYSDANCQNFANKEMYMKADATCYPNGGDGRPYPVYQYGFCSNNDIFVIGNCNSSSCNPASCSDNAVFLNKTQCFQGDDNEYYKFISCGDLPADKDLGPTGSVLEKSFTALGCQGTVSTVSVNQNLNPCELHNKGSQSQKITCLGPVAFGKWFPYSNTCSGTNGTSLSVLSNCQNNLATSSVTQCLSDPIYTSVLHVQGFMDAGCAQKSGGDMYILADQTCGRDSARTDNNTLTYTYLWASCNAQQGNVQTDCSRSDCHTDSCTPVKNNINQCFSVDTFHGKFVECLNLTSLLAVPLPKDGVARLTYSGPSCPGTGLRQLAIVTGCQNNDKNTASDKWECVNGAPVGTHYAQPNCIGIESALTATCTGQGNANAQVSQEFVCLSTLNGQLNAGAAQSPLSVAATAAVMLLLALLLATAF